MYNAHDAIDSAEIEAAEDAMWALFEIECAQEEEDAFFDALADDDDGEPFDWGSWDEQEEFN